MRLDYQIALQPHYLPVKPTSIGHSTTGTLLQFLFLPSARVLIETNPIQVTNKSPCLYALLLLTPNPQTPHTLHLSTANNPLRLYPIHLGGLVFKIAIGKFHLDSGKFLKGNGKFHWGSFAAVA